MIKTIDSFSEEFAFLSNFWPCQIEFDGLLFPSTEHAFVAAKTLDRTLRAKVQSIGTPGKAKRFGRSLKLRDDWESIKFDVMLELLRKKFEIPELREALLATGDAILIEGCWWHDVCWGVCSCGGPGFCSVKNQKGANWLGRLLIQIRDEIRSQQQ